GGTLPLPNVAVGETTAEPWLVSGITAAVGRPAAASDDNPAARDEHMIATITAHTPAVIASHKTSPVSLSSRPSTLEAASVAMIHSCAVVFGRETLSR